MLQQEIRPARTYFPDGGQYHRPQGLNGRVRDGIGCGPLGMSTGQCDVPPERATRARDGTLERGTGNLRRDLRRTTRFEALAGLGRYRGRCTDVLSVFLSGTLSGADGRKSGQADRPVSTGPLSALPRVHVRPINLVVFEGPDGEDSFWSWLHAYMLSAFLRSRHSYPALPLARQPAHQRSVRPNPLVLGSHLLNPPTPTTDRDRPGSRRSEPSSRIALIGEQPNPWRRSACYPRSTFCLMSDVPSTRIRRITKPCFRICSTHRSHS
jgi:hypothetical protein